VSASLETQSDKLGACICGDCKESSEAQAAIAGSEKYLIKAFIQLWIFPICEGMQPMLCCHTKKSAVKDQILIGAFSLPLTCRAFVLRCEACLVR